MHLDTMLASTTRLNGWSKASELHQALQAVKQLLSDKQREVGQRSAAGRYVGPTCAAMTLPKQRMSLNFGITDQSHCTALCSMPDGLPPQAQPTAHAGKQHGFQHSKDANFLHLRTCPLCQAIDASALQPMRRRCVSCTCSCTGPSCCMHSLSTNACAAALSGWTGR